jgi:drug/metabolite transporter (DMT)-like permease
VVFIGVLLVASLCYFIFGNSEKLPTTNLQWGVLIYLGTIASGLRYFAWNKGATLVNVSVLAVMNNLLIPTGVLVNVGVLAVMNNLLIPTGVLVNVGVLAVMNNLLIPTGVLINVVIWNRDADLLRLSIGGATILSALVLNQWLSKRAKLAVQPD